MLNSTAIGTSAQQLFCDADHLDSAAFDERNLEECIRTQAENGDAGH